MIYTCILSPALSTRYARDAAQSQSKGLPKGLAVRSPLD
jgi:hypothetical protein